MSDSGSELARHFCPQSALRCSRHPALPNGSMWRLAASTTLRWSCLPTNAGRVHRSRGRG